MENRRDFIKKVSLLTGALGFSGIMPESIQKALAINPALGSTYLDAEHIVFLMQENRSFDHAYGTLKGVRGFNDPRAIKLPNKYPVWLQSNKKGETYGPFRLNIKDTKATWMSALPHSWENQVDARANGHMNGWLEAKRSGNKEYADMPLTMGFYNRDDIPFYYALADAFTICDHNFCSSLTGTSSNRCFFWTGKIRAEQNETSKPHLSNGDIDGSERLSWSTFPEKLSENGVDWKVYQNELSVGVGFEGEEDSWLSNFTDNDLEFFKQYHVKRHPEHLAYLKKAKLELEQKLAANKEAKMQEKLDWLNKEIEFLTNNTLAQLSAKELDLHRRAFVTNRNDPHYHQLDTLTYMDKGIERTAQIPKGDVLYQFRKDVDEGKLPTVSWLVAPANFSDHPGAPWYGAWYLSEAIDILTKNPEVWKKTIFVLTYDENDGYFDHIPPFVVPNPKDPNSGKVSASLDTRAEYIQKEQSSRQSPTGLGFRVPMVVVSPWSRGGYVNSQVFDHTSSIRFLENFISHKLGKNIVEDNISSWRRSVCGDLTSVFRPYNGEKIALPQPVARVPFIESIHKAKFAKLPDGYRQFTSEMIAEVNKNTKNSLLPKQEKGIKSANTIPYEAYAHGRLVAAAFRVEFEAGNTFFKKAASGISFNVYGHEVDPLSFTAAAGDRITFDWPLHQLENKAYDLKIYSANGFYRAYQGNENDPQIQVQLLYHNPKGTAKTDGNAYLHIKRMGESKSLNLILVDNAYGHQELKVTLPVGTPEVVIPIALEKSFGWYDLSLKVAGFAHYQQQYAGHVEHGKASFTDPLMGDVLKK